MIARPTPPQRTRFAAASPNWRAGAGPKTAFAAARSGKCPRRLAKNADDSSRHGRDSFNQNRHSKSAVQRPGITELDRRTNHRQGREIARRLNQRVTSNPQQKARVTDGAGTGMKGIVL